MPEHYVQATARAMLNTRFLVFFLSQLVFADAVMAESAYPRVEVADPYLELYTGPGKGFPIFHVVERGEWVDILMRRTDWFKVRTKKGKVGWVDRRQMENTLNEAGVKKTFRDIMVEDYLARKWEAGFGWGMFEDDPMFIVRVGYRFTENFMLDLALGQVSGTFSTSDLVHLNLVAQPFSEWRISPYFSIGVGRFRNQPQATLVQALSTDADSANAAVGMKIYFTRRFMGVVELRDYVAFIGDNRSEEYRSLTGGFSFFF